MIVCLAVRRGQLALSLQQARPQHAPVAAVRSGGLDAPIPGCRWHRSVDQVAAALPADVTLTQWRLQIYTHTPYPSDYKQFRQMRGGLLPPLPTPEALSSMPQPAVQQEGSDKQAQEDLPGDILLPEAFASLAAAEAEATRSPEVRVSQLACHCPASAVRTDLAGLAAAEGAGQGA